MLYQILEVNLKEQTPLPSANKAAHSGFKTTRDIRSLKQGYQWPHKKDLCHPIVFKNFIIPTVTPAVTETVIPTWCVPLIHGFYSKKVQEIMLVLVVL